MALAFGYSGVLVVTYILRAEYLAHVKAGKLVQPAADLAFSTGNAVADARFSFHNFSMTNALPVLVRELRQESRRPVNYWLRVLAAAVIVGVFAGFMAGTEVAGSRLGAALFAALQRGLSFAIWIIVPMMTADCISREKREGTLGLLFLTPLNVLDVVMGKAATHVLRGATLFLASVPVLVMPFVLGGVGWPQALLAIAKVANALLLGLGAGLYASAKGGSAIQVMVMSAVYALGLAAISFLGQGLFGFMAGASVRGLIWQLGTTAGLAGGLFAMVLRASARLLRETWDQDSAAPGQPEWVEVFAGSEFWRALFHWKRGPALDRNPMAWLQEYSWTARLTKWGWLFVILMAELLMLGSFPGRQPQLTAVLSLGVAFSATVSFRRERQDGLLELLLVTPLSVRQLVGGRLCGICFHFLPAFAVLMLCWNGERLLNPTAFHTDPFVLVFPNPLAFGSLMVVGLYLSLRRLNTLVAWLLGWTVVFLIPAFFAVTMDRSGAMHPMSIVAITSAFQVVLACVGWFLLYRDIKQRRFVSVDVI